MKHSRADYNGRVVDLCEPQIVAAINDAITVLQLTEGATGPTSEQIQSALEGLTGLYAFHEGEDFGAIKPIPAEEPVFLVRGQDLVASDVVRVWGAYNEGRGGDINLTHSARAHADLMDQWPIKKLADIIKAE